MNISSGQFSIQFSKKNVNIKILKELENSISYWKTEKPWKGICLALFCSLINKKNKDQPFSEKTKAFIGQTMSYLGKTSQNNFSLYFIVKFKILNFVVNNPSTQRWSNLYIYFFFLLCRKTCWFMVTVSMILSINKIMLRFNLSWWGAFNRDSMTLLAYWTTLWLEKKESFCVEWMSQEMRGGKWDSAIKRFVYYVTFIHSDSFSFSVKGGNKVI